MADARIEPGRRKGGKGQGRSPNRSSPDKSKSSNSDSGKAARPSRIGAESTSKSRSSPSRETRRPVKDAVTKDRHVPAELSGRSSFTPVQAAMSPPGQSNPTKAAVAEYTVANAIAADENATYQTIHPVLNKGSTPVKSYDFFFGDNRPATITEFAVGGHPVKVVYPENVNSETGHAEVDGTRSLTVPTLSIVGQALGTLPRMSLDKIQTIEVSPDGAEGKTFMKTGERDESNVVTIFPKDFESSAKNPGNMLKLVAGMLRHEAAHGWATDNPFFGNALDPDGVFNKDDQLQEQWRGLSEDEGTLDGSEDGQTDLLRAAFLDQFMSHGTAGGTGYQYVSAQMAPSASPTSALMSNLVDNGPLFGWNKWKQAMGSDGAHPSLYSGKQPADKVFAEDMAEFLVLYQAVKGTQLEPQYRSEMPARFYLVDEITKGLDAGSSPVLNWNPTRVPGVSSVSPGLISV